MAQAQLSLDISLSVNGSAAGEWKPAIIQTASNSIVNNVGYTTANASLWFHDISVDSDPSISASVDVVNTTGSVQTYDLIFSMLVSPAITGSSLMGGSVQGGVTDTTGDGAILSTAGPGTALYYGRIDGVNVLPLFANPKSITAGGFLSNSDSTNAGLPGPSMAGPAVNTSIGIEHEFTLTPGDRATFTSVFVVTNAVPEPASLSLLAFGGLMVVCRRRR
ncbi:MAG TPA: PEP-CTERM sorting domain-containing protein [Candidatus Dormibacteraeota bacterium]|nr:PEP-CTERM sorting domain-containing protein [Candidatus Dormibacteraeota bacterium]